jgi:hypothetical protein
MNDLNLKTSPEAPAGFAYGENHVRAQLGLPKDEIRDLRHAHLTEGVDWVLKKKRIWLSPLAVEKLVAATGLGTKNPRPNAQNENADDAEALKSKSPPTESPKNPNLKANPAGPLTLIVVQQCKNRRMIQACAMEDNPIQPKAMVRVRVRSNENFRRHMVIPVTPVAGYDDMFDLARPCPKKPGKW